MFYFPAYVPPLRQSYCTVCTETYIRTKNVLAGIAIVIIVSMSIVDISVDNLKFSCEDTNITSKLCK